ncbi:MAG: OmpA family protein, partial [Gemmatimonadota bacterium]|nr:OmpA family protein [Gemmatimonadota bacterium]
MNWKLPPTWVAFVVLMGLIPAAGKAQDVVTNTASAVYETLAGTDSVQSDSAITTITYPEAVLEKLLVGPQMARIGEEITYTIRYGNASASVPLRDAALSDTLPDGLEFVSATPAPQVNGQILTWSPGDLAPNSMYEMTVRVRVAADVRDTVQAMNVTVLSGLNSGVMMAQAPAVELIGINSAQLSLEKTADLLEVALGETAPYTLTLENTGVVALSDLRIHDSLPEGSRYTNGSLLGADSIQANGRNLTIFVAGPLAPGATHTVRYATAVVSAEEDVIENTAYATAEGGFVRSADVVAWVQLKRGWPMATRAVIGKVWVDLNDDRRQNAGEPGVDGVDIWTDDGEVVRTDLDGRFSLRNLRAGRHGFRLDPATLPLEYRVERLGLAEDLVIRDADGWTSPRVNFRLVPRLGQITEVRVPLAWSFAAENLCTAIRDSANRANADPFELRRVQPRLVSFDVTAPQLVLSGVTFELAKADLRAESHAVLDRVAATLAEHPNVTVQISGHTDITGTREVNTELAIARANSVLAYLASQGVDTARMSTRGFGPDRPVATNDTPEGRQQNR